MAAVAGLGKDEERMVDLMADFMDEIEALCATLLHTEAIDEPDRTSNCYSTMERGLGFCALLDFDSVFVLSK